MKSKERIKRALTFNKPERVPFFKVPFGDVFPLKWGKYPLELLS